MSLECLAIIGKTNEPLYLLDVEKEDDEVTPDENDAFGFVESQQRERLSLEKEFMMHASIDNLEEALGSQRQGKGRASADSKWIGLLCPMEESFIYGYSTSTNIKILAMISDSMEDSREVHLKTLFAKVHNLFVEYMLNPWAGLQNKIESKKFESGIQEAVKVYNETNGIAWA
mmetsp:Transcript_7226/g.10575  ORF Transcript_7226/g.10575 Transcript_7226/m.10575 type:complete len:173 (-) Transcript_7226:1028-1546(-)